MFIFGHLFIGIAKLISMVFSIMYFILIVRIIMSWVNADPYNEIVRIVYKITDPILMPIKKYLPVQLGMIDLSPIVAFLLLHFLSYFLVNVLMAIGRNLL